MDYKEPAEESGETKIASFMSVILRPESNRRRNTVSIGSGGDGTEAISQPRPAILKMFEGKTEMDKL